MFPFETSLLSDTCLQPALHIHGAFVERIFLPSVLAYFGGILPRPTDINSATNQIIVVMYR